MRRVAASLLLGALVSSLGCRGGDAKSKRGAHQSEPAPAEEPPRGEPIEIPGSLRAERSVYQSRGVVTLSLAAGRDINLGDRFRLVNDTTTVTLIDRQHQGAGLLPTSDVVLVLNLLDPVFAGGFVPGENRLRLLVEDDGSERMARASITLRDFPAFGFTTGLFDSGEQRSRGFQGSFEPVTRAIVPSRGRGFLATGFISISNQ